MGDIHLHRYAGRAALTVPLGPLLDAYRAVFTVPPWNDPPEAVEEFAERLLAHVDVPGFTLLTATDGDVVTGFAMGWLTPEPFPTARSFAKVAAGLGADLVRELLIGAFNVDELGVTPAARGGGLGRDLLAGLVRDAPDGRAWLLTFATVPQAVTFYRRQGWIEVPYRTAVQTRLVVLLGPGHPAGATVAAAGS